ncbi:DUF2029 domain-containing protein [Candidatus Shapirobacteria bacterium]|nr:DUF2029 domain-containing protein [Candidatus Shapirobacteria bacterium]
MRKILLFAATLYLLIAPFTYHPDNKLVLYYATLGNGKVWDIYSYLNTNYDAAPKFHYPPVHYWVVKAEYPIVRMFGGEGLDSWLRRGANEAFDDSNIFLYNLATKIPLLVMVLLTGWTIYKICLQQGYDKYKSRLAATIWLFNPVTLYSAVLMGQNDMLAITPFMLGWYLLAAHPWVAFVIFGIAGGIKTYPLIWAIYLAMTYIRFPVWKRVLLAVTSVVVYFLTMAPFLKFEYFRNEVLYSGLSTRMFEAGIDIGLGDRVLIVPLLLGILLLVAIRRKVGKSLTDIVKLLVAVNLIILGFIHFHPQWFIWVLPFMSIYLAHRRKDFLSLLMIVGVMFGVVLLFDDKFLYWGILSPLNNGLLNLPLIRDVLIGRGVDVVLLSNLLHSLAAALSGYWFWKVLSEKNR